MTIISSDKKWILFISILMMMVFFVTNYGCVSSQKGRLVPEINRIPLKDGGPHQGIWESERLIFNYTYTRAPNQLRLSGEIRRNNLRAGRIVRQFSFWLYLIDTEGKSLGHRVIATSRTTGRGTKLSLNRDIELPPNTEAIAFGYKGTLSEGGPRATIVDYFVIPF